MYQKHKQQYNLYQRIILIHPIHIKDFTFYLMGNSNKKDI